MAYCAITITGHNKMNCTLSFLHLNTGVQISLNTRPVFISE